MTKQERKQIKNYSVLMDGIAPDDERVAELSQLSEQELMMKWESAKRTLDGHEDDVYHATREIEDLRETLLRIK